MTIEAAFTEVLSPVLERIERAGEEIARQAELARRMDATGVPTDRAAFTVREVSDLLRVDPETVREWLRSGRLAGEQTTRRFLVWRWSLLEFMGLHADPIPPRGKPRG